MSMMAIVGACLLFVAAWSVVLGVSLLALTIS
jgi:hypothetical protein